MGPVDERLSAALVLCAALTGVTAAGWSAGSEGSVLSAEAVKSATGAGGDSAVRGLWPVCPYNASVSLEELLDQVSCVTACRVTCHKTMEHRHFCTVLAFLHS